MAKFYYVLLAISMIASMFVLSGCNTQLPSTPTPFVPGNEVEPIQGCITLRKEVDDYNTKHPSTPITADC